jgi:hypothetical protein
MAAKKVQDLVPQNRACCRITGTGGRDRSGGVPLLQLRRIRSSRYRQISSGTCIPHGGWLFQHGAGAVRRMHRYAVSRHQFQVCRWMIVVRLLAFVHQSYDYCTIITHMRINHLKDRYMTQSGRGHLSRIPGSAVAVFLAAATGARSMVKISSGYIKAGFGVILLVFAIQRILNLTHIF